MHRSYLYPHNLFIFAFLEKRDALFLLSENLVLVFSEKNRGKNLGFPKLFLRAHIPHRNSGA